jgi:predicted amidohydrolase YtcJ
MLAITSKDTSYKDWKPTSYGPFLEVRCLKLFMDGALGSRGAKMIHDYQDDPGNSGLLIWEQEELLPILKFAKDAGFQVGTHAIGDLAVRLLLDAYEKIGVNDLRWRIEHVQLLDKDDLKRFKKLGVIAAMQPLHLSADLEWCEARVGKERAEQCAFMWRDLLDAGALIAGGSDAPVVEINPLWGIYTAITRQDLQGEPKGGWNPAQRVSPEEALRMYTKDAAYAGFREETLGTITVGKLADLVVLPENILTCDPKKLIDMQVLYTIVDGKIVYSKEGDDII